MTLGYSIVIPVYNEENSLRPLVEELASAMEDLQEKYEIIFVNDGSSDESLSVLEALKKEFPQRMEIINLSSHQGQTSAMREGLRGVKGAVAITLDADLQNNPADIPKLLAKIALGYDVVCGWRKDRQDPALKVVLSQLANFSQQLVTGLKVHDVACTLRAYRRECLTKILLEREGQHRFIPLVLSRQGFRVGEIIVHHRPRKYGISKYRHDRAFKVVADFVRILFHKGPK
jgi:glycosyltransferase involved in cell wall biosynthesis